MKTKVKTKSAVMTDVHLVVATAILFGVTGLSFAFLPGPRFGLPAPKLPDLVVDNLTYVPNLNGGCTSTANMVARFTNRGTGALKDPFQIDASANISGYYQGGSSVYNEVLMPGQSANLSINIGYLCNVAPSILKASIDSRYTVIESNENNNSFKRMWP